MAARGGTADLSGLAPPYGIMPVVWPDKRMGNLVKDGVVNMCSLRMPHIMSGQGNHAPRVVTLASTPPGVIQPDGPAVQAVLAHQLSGCIEGRLQRPVANF